MIKKIFKLIIKIILFKRKSVHTKEGLFSQEQIFFPRDRHNMTIKEAVAVAKSVYKGRLTSFSGDNVRKFESKFAKYHSKKYALAVNSGTSALQIALSALGVKRGDEVIVPALTFVSTASSVIACNATPIFVDVSKKDGNIDVKSIEKTITGRTKAIIPVHLCGIPCDMDEIMAISKKYNTGVIEDVAQACGSKYRGKMLGSIGDMGCFSFHEAKNIVTGEGGMVITDDENYYNMLAIISNIGRSDLSGKCIRTSISDDTVQFANLGFNYRMTDMQAAIGNVQIDRINELINRRRKNADYLGKKLSLFEEFEFPDIPSYKEPAYNTFLVKINKDCWWINRDWLYNVLIRKGVPVSLPYSRPVNEHPLFFSTGRNAPLKSFENARYLIDNSIVFNVGPHLREKDMKKITDIVEEVLINNRWGNFKKSPVIKTEPKSEISFQHQSESFVAGSFKTDITPKGRGFKLIAGSAVAKGVSDPLFARTLIIGTKRQGYICMIQLDLFGMNYNCTLRIRKMISEATGIPVKNIFIFFSHTHSSPELLGFWGGIDDKSYFESLYRETLNSVVGAYRNLQKAQIYIASSHISTYVKNFYNEDEVDDNLFIIDIKDSNSSTISKIINLAVHSPRNGEFSYMKSGLISAELPGYLCQKSDELFGGVSLFVNGMLGVNEPNLDVIKESFMEPPLNYRQTKSCVRFGDKIMHVINGLEFYSLKGDISISSDVKEIGIPCTNAFLFENYILNGYARDLKKNILLTEIAIITIGNIEIATFPGELHSSLGKDIRKKMSKPYKLIFCLSNDCLGYIIPADHFFKGRIKEKESLGPETWSFIKSRYYEFEQRTSI